MRQALVAVPQHVRAAKARPSESSGTLPRLSPEKPGEIREPNYNPYVTRLLTLYSQARKNNGGTRGLDSDCAFHIRQHGLDQNLAPAIADGRFRW